MKDYDPNKAIKIIEEALKHAMSDPVPIMVDQAPATLELYNQKITYRITVYRNVLDGFEVYNN